MKESKNIRKNQLGASLLEYSILVSLISVVAVGAVRTLGIKVGQSMLDIGDSLEAGGGELPCDVDPSSPACP